MKQAEEIRQTKLGRCETVRDGLRCDQVAGHPDSHNFAHDRAKRYADTRCGVPVGRLAMACNRERGHTGEHMRGAAALAPRTDAAAVEARLRSEIDSLRADVARLTARLDSRHA